MRTSIESVRGRHDDRDAGAEHDAGGEPAGERRAACAGPATRASIDGAISTSAWPATSDFTPFARAASADSALSGVSGPSTTARAEQALRRHRLERHRVGGRRGTRASTQSIAASSATCGAAMPSARASSIVFCTMSCFAARFGAMFICASASEQAAAAGPADRGNRRATAGVRCAGPIRAPRPARAGRRC